VIPRFDTVHTARLLLRRWRESDREPFAAMNADPEVMRHFPAPLDRSASDALMDRIESGLRDRGFGLWALELSGTGEFVGFTGLNPMPRDVPGAGDLEVGWRLARSAWHHGYATEAALAVADLAFGPLGTPRIWSMTAVTNTRSQAVMRRLGMTLHARFDHPRIPPGHPLRPHVVYLLEPRAGKAGERRADHPERDEPTAHADAGRGRSSGPGSLPDPGEEPSRNL
jgi:RimJ/RimL family protein N-acetyltransferase